VRVGLISDTHGLLRPQALAALDGCDHIVHAGDICDPDVLARLSTLAPVTAVRGNNDVGAWAAALPHSTRIEIGGISLYAVHDVKEIDIDPATAGIHVVVSGHSHKPSVVDRGGVLWVNPGSAGRRRFSLPISLGELLIEHGSARARIIPLEV
jgi:uncharacterized protein